MILRGLFAGVALFACANVHSAADEHRPGVRATYDSAIERIYSYSGTGPALREAEYMLNGAENSMGAAPLLWLARAELKFRVWRFKQSYSARREAEYLVNKALQLDGDLADAYALLGRIEWARGCVICAKVRSEQALAIEPSNARGTYLRAAVHAAVGDDASAERYLQQALSAPGSEFQRLDMLVSHAAILAERKNFDRAEQLLVEALKLAGPDQVQPLRVQYATLLILDHGKLKEGMEQARLAAKAGSPEAKELLDLTQYVDWAKAYLASGRNPKGYATTGSGYLPVQQAFVKAAGHRSTAVLARALLKASAITDVDLKDDVSDTALIAAARADEAELARELVLRQAAVNALNGRSERALTFSVMSGNGRLVDFLLKHGAEVNYTDVDGRSPLSIGVQKGDVELVRRLLKANARMSPDGAWSSSRLITTAAELGNIPLIEELLNRGAPINDKDVFGRTALIAATIAGHVHAVQVLLTRGADASAEYENRTALNFAEQLGDKSLIDLLKGAQRYGT